MDFPFAADLCFQNEYDSRGRLIYKQEPAVGRISMVYNLKDELVLSQTAEQKTSAQWSFYKNDALGRTMQSGIYSSSSTHTSLQNIANGTTSTTDAFLQYLLNLGSSVVVRGTTFTNAKVYVQHGIRTVITMKNARLT